MNVASWITPRGTTRPRHRAAAEVGPETVNHASVDQAVLEPPDRRPGADRGRKSEKVTERDPIPDLMFKLVAGRRTGYLGDLSLLHSPPPAEPVRGRDVEIPDRSLPPPRPVLTEEVIPSCRPCWVFRADEAMYRTASQRGGTRCNAGPADPCRRLDPISFASDRRRRRIPLDRQPAEIHLPSRRRVHLDQVRVVARHDRDPVAGLRVAPHPLNGEVCDLPLQVHVFQPLRDTERHGAIHAGKLGQRWSNSQVMSAKSMRLFLL